MSFHVGVKKRTPNVTGIIALSQRKAGTFFIATNGGVDRPLQQGNGSRGGRQCPVRPPTPEVAAVRVSPLLASWRAIHLSPSTGRQRHPDHCAYNRSQRRQHHQIGRASCRERV